MLNAEHQLYLISSWSLINVHIGTIFMDFFNLKSNEDVIGIRTFDILHLYWLLLHSMSVGCALNRGCLLRSKYTEPLENVAMVVVMLGSRHPVTPQGIFYI